MRGDKTDGEVVPTDSGRSRLNQIVFDAFGSAIPKESLFEAVVSDIVDAVREFLATNPAFPATVLITGSALRSFVLRKCGFFGDSGSLDERVVKAVSQEISDHYQHRPEIVERRERRRARADEVRGAPLDTIDEVKSALGLEELKWLGTIVGGRSGAIVVKTYIRERSVNEAVGILKLTRRYDDYERERGGYEAALRDWFRAWVTAKPLACECPSGFFALLSRLAFPPDISGDDSDSLENIVLRGERGRAMAVMSELGGAYASHLPGSERKYETPSEFVRSVVRHWPVTAARRVWSEDDLWTMIGLPGPHTPAFIDGAAVRWNPLWLVGRDLGRQGERRVYFSSLQHGDLNTRNVLVRRAQGTVVASHLVQFIDLEKTERTSSLLDVCWLALWIVVAAGSRVPGAAPEHWAALPDRFVDAVVGGSLRDEDLGPFQLGIDLASALMGGMRDISKRFDDSATKGFWENRLYDQLRLTLGVTSLVMTYYEARNLERAFDEGEDMASSSCQVSTLWAVTFFRIAAAALKEYGEGAPDGTRAANIGELVKGLAR